MNKKLLSEIAFYYGTVKMPKGFEIRKDVLVKNVSLSQLYIDVNHDFNREFDKLRTYICDYMRVDHGYDLVLKDNWGNYFERNEKTLFEINTKITKQENVVWFVIGDFGKNVKYRYNYRGTILKGIVEYKKIVNILMKKEQDESSHSR